MGHQWETRSEWPDPPEAQGRRLGTIGSVPVYFRKGSAKVMAALGVVIVEGLAGIALGSALVADVALVGALGVLAGLVLHETGHGIAAKLRKQTICYAVLSSKAAVVVGGRGETYSAKDLAVIVTAGPLANAVFAAASGGAATLIAGPLRYGLVVTCLANLVFVLNLVPRVGTGALGARTPSDGLRLQKALRAARTGIAIPTAEF